MESQQKLSENKTFFESKLKGNDFAIIKRATTLELLKKIL